MEQEAVALITEGDLIAIENEFPVKHPLCLQWHSNLAVTIASSNCQLRAVGLMSLLLCSYLQLLFVFKACFATGNPRLIEPALSCLHKLVIFRSTNAVYMHPWSYGSMQLPYILIKPPSTTTRTSKLPTLVNNQP